MKKILGVILASIILLSGCASVPMATRAESEQAKQFTTEQDKSKIYIFRESMFGGKGLRKALWVDGEYIGRLVDGSFTVKVVDPGEHLISTKSEFGNNHLYLKTEANTNYFVQQYIKFGVFIGGSALIQLPEEKGTKEVLKCDLIIPQSKSNIDLPEQSVKTKLNQLKYGN